MGGHRHRLTAGRHRPDTRIPGRTAAGAAVLAALILPVAFVAVFFAWPVLAMLGLGFISDGRVELSGVGELLSRARTLRVIGQTLGMAGSATLLSLAAGIPLAAVLYRRRFPGRSLLRLLVTVPFVMPTVSVALAFRSLLHESGPLGGLGLDGTVTAVVIAMTFFNIAIVVRTVGGSWESLDPRMEEAALVLGASPATVFRTVTLPRLLPAIGAAAAIVFLFCATSFALVILLGGIRVGTIETEIYYQTTHFLDLRAASVLSVLQLIIVAGLLIVAGWSRRRRTADRRSGVRHAVRPATRRDAVGVAFAVIVAAALSIPILSLVIRSFAVPGGWGIDNYLALATGGARNALRISVWEALGNSLAFGIGATVLALLLGLLAALALSRPVRNRFGRRALRGVDHALMLPLGVSAVTVGLGILITLGRPPFAFHSSPFLVVVAQALVALPLVLRSILPALDGIDPKQRDALRVLGAGPLRVLRDVDLAVLRRPLVAATALAFAVCIGEFGATSFLTRPEYATLPIVIHRLVDTPGAGNLGMAFAASVVLALLTVGGMALVERSRVTSAAAF